MRADSTLCPTLHMSTWRNQCSNNQCSNLEFWLGFNKVAVYGLVIKLLTWVDYDGSDKNIFMISVIAGGKKRLKFVEIMSCRGCRGGGREGKTNTRPIWARRGIGNHQLPPPVPPSSTSLGPDPAPCNTQLPKLGSITDFGNIGSAHL